MPKSTGLQTASVDEVASANAASVSDLLDTGLSPDDIAALARKVQFDKASATALSQITKAPPLTDEQVATVCDFLLAPVDPTAFPPDITGYLAGLGAALASKDATQISQQMLMTLRAVILQRGDLIPLRTNENNDLEKPAQLAN